MRARHATEVSLSICSLKQLLVGKTQSLDVFCGQDWPIGTPAWRRAQRPKPPLFSGIGVLKFSFAQQLYFFASDHCLSCYPRLACYSCFTTLYTQKNKLTKTLCISWQSSRGQLRISLKHQVFPVIRCLSSSFAYAIGYSESTVSEITTFVFASGDDLIVPKRGYQKNTINYELFAFFPVVS